MANPIVTAAKAALKHSDDLDFAAKNTADGFSDEFLSSIPESPQLTRKEVYSAEGSKKTAKDIQSDISGTGVSISISGKGDRATLNKIVIPEHERGAGKGTEAMNKVTQWADETNTSVALTPSSDFGGNKKRLADFYKRFGFIENKGKNKDFEISESMYRPAKAASAIAGVAAVGATLTPSEAKAAPLEMTQLNAALLDDEGKTVDAEYLSMIETREKATEQQEFNKLLQDDTVMGDIAEGVVETPLQVIGGVADAVNETLDMTKELGDWLSENFVDLGGITWGEDGVELASGEDVAKAEGTVSIPTTGKADSTTGNVVRGISQFIAGFFGAGKIKAIQALKPATTAGKMGKAAAQGAIADFTVFDPQEERLSNLVEEYPDLKNPVTEFLAAAPDDNAAEGRFKNAIEGLALGAISDVAIEGLSKGLKMIKKGKQVKEAAAEEAGGLGAKGGERFDPDITPQEIEAAVNTPGVKDLPESTMTPEELLNQPKVAVKEGEVFVNWGRIDAPEDVKTVMRDMADSMKSDIDTARRGKQTFQQIKLNAEGVDAWDALQTRREGQPLNAEQSVAARELWARSADNLTKVAKEAAISPTPANLMAFRKMTTVHQAVQREVIAARTETARALASWRIPAGNMKMDDIESMLSMTGGSKGAQEMARMVADLAEQGMIKEMDQFIEKSAAAKSAAAVKQFFYFSLLSGPKTHIRNIAGAASAMTQQMYERKAANLLGQALGDVNVANGEAMSMVTSLIRGSREAFVTSSKGKRLLRSAKELRREGDIAGADKIIEESGAEVGTARKYIATGKSGWGTGKVDETMQGAFDPEVWNVQKESIVGRGLSLINNVTMVPGHALGLMDEVSSTIASRMEINARAVRQASKEVSEGAIPQSELKDRIQYLTDNPDQATMDASRDFAKQVTFTGTPEDTKFWRAFSSVGKMPVIGTIIMPFARTPFNIAKYTFERTPMAPLVKQWRDDMAAGGARADLAIAKTATGSMIMLAMADLAMNGDITGSGPSNYKENEQLRRTGWQANSIRTYDEEGNAIYYGVSGMEPFSTPIMLASNMVEIMQNSDIGDEDEAVQQAWLAATMAVANQVTSQQYMSGVSGFFEAMSDPKRYGQGFFNRLAGATIPTGINEVTKSVDPYVRTAMTMTESIQKRTPGLSKGLPMNTDVWGRPLSYRSEMGAMYDAFSPVAVSSTVKQEPIDKELGRLEKYVAKPSKKTNFNGVSINLKKYPKAYADMVTSSNTLTKTEFGAPIDIDGGTMLETLNSLVSGTHTMSFDYNMRTDGSDGGKAQMIQSIVTKFQNAARQEVLKNYPDVAAEYNLKQTQKNTKYNF